MIDLATRTAAAAAARLPVLSRLSARLGAVRDAVREPLPAVEPAPVEALLVSGHLVPVEGVDIVEALDRPFTARDRDPARVIMAMIHESVTTSTAATEATLRKRAIKIDGEKVRDQLGVHAILDPAGPVHQHNDCGTDRLIHAAGRNGPSAGIEMVTPYYPEHLRAGMPWKRVIDTRWAHKRRYVVPTRAQLEALVAVLRSLFQATAQGLISIAQAWPGLEGNLLAMSRVPADLRAAHGVHAHTYSDHADGAFPVLYALLRIERSLGPAEAYKTAIRLASAPKWRRDTWCVDLRGIGR